MWFDCKNDPPETGRKVLCHHHGYIFVAYRIRDVYIATPFFSHSAAKEVSDPDCWSPIEFPGKLTGHIIVQVAEDGQTLTLSECEIYYPEIFAEIADGMIEGLGVEVENEIRD